MSIRNVAGVEAIEALPLVDRALPPSTYEALAETVIRAVAQKAGATISDLGFEHHPQAGQVVRVRAGEGAARLRTALDRYLFESEV